MIEPAIAGVAKVNGAVGAVVSPLHEGSAASASLKEIQMFKLGFVFSCLMLVACGGDDGSGVSGSKQVVALSEDELGSVCEHLVDIAVTATCDGVKIPIGPESKAECVADLKDVKIDTPNCQITVSQFESCFEDLASLSDEKFCSGDLPASCAPLFTETCGGAPD